jgi:chromosome segregation ATPase
MSRRNSDNNLYPSTRPPPPYNGGSQPRQTYGGSFTHPYGVSTTNAGVNFKSGATNSPRRHSEQLAGMGGVGGKRDGDFPRSQSPTSSSGTNSSNMGTAMAKLSPAGKPPVAPLNVPSSGRSGRPATGPVRAAHTVQGTRERSQSVDSIEGTESAIEMGGGMRGRMRDVEDDAVLISVTSTSQAGDSSDLVRPPLSSVTRRDGSVPPTSSTGLTASQEPLMRQGSSGSPYNSGDIRSGEGVFGQPHSSQFPTGTSDQNKAKAVTGEGSIDFSQYKRALSKTSSSGSSYEALPGTKRSTSRDEKLFELSEQRDQEVTELTERLSVVEGEKEQLRKEKEKLERKLNEAKQVAAQADVAVTEISRLEAELKKEKDDMLKLRRARQTSPEAEERSFSLKLSHELDIVRAKLECEVSARAAVEQEMSSLKQSLVVSGQDGRTAIVSKLRQKVTELEGTVDGLRQALAGKELTLVDKEVETKRQNQVQARTIADLQSKLSEARQQREELRQSSGSGARTPGVGSTTAVSSPDVAAMVKQLREKEATIQMYSQQLQQFEKTAREVAKITLHSKQQSQKVATLKENLDHTQEALGKKEAELKAVQDELAGMKTHYDNILRTKTAQLAKKDETVKQLREETGDLTSQVAQLVEAEAKRSEAEQALQRAQTQLNHWKQKSIQQDMVIQTKNQELERGRREMDGLKTTVSAQGKEVERLQRENDALRGDMETHRLTAMTYKEDFESERKDREAVHTKIADMETRYRHQLEAMGEQLRRVTEEAERHRETVATKEDELHQQSQLMTAELHQKEAELSSAGQQIQTLKEEVMSKTQQVKQYKKQIDQLTSEAATFKQQAQGHMEQIEFYAKKTEEYGRQKTFREIHERKIVQLEAQCDRLRADNNVCYFSSFSPSKHYCYHNASV